MYWYISYGIKNDQFIKISKKILYSDRKPFYLRAVCILILGLQGTTSDLESLEELYFETEGLREQIQIIISLERMEKRRKNMLLVKSKNQLFTIILQLNLLKQIL